MFFFVFRVLKILGKKTIFLLNHIFFEIENFTKHEIFLGFFGFLQVFDFFQKNFGVLSGRHLAVSGTRVFWDFFTFNFLAGCRELYVYTYKLFLGTIFHSNENNSARFALVYKYRVSAIIQHGKCYTREIKKNSHVKLVSKIFFIYTQSEERRNFLNIFF